MKVHLQSSDPEDLELFFTLLSKKIVINETSFTSANGESHFLFNLNFKELQKCVTKGVDVKENANTKIIGRIGKYRATKMSFQKIADKLNNQGFKNSVGNKFNRMQVLRLYGKYKK